VECIKIDCSCQFKEISGFVDSRIKCTAANVTRNGGVCSATSGIVVSFGEVILGCKRHSIMYVLISINSSIWSKSCDG
jgi:hypothetical protein